LLDAAGEYVVKHAGGGDDDAEAQADAEEQLGERSRLGDWLIEAEELAVVGARRRLFGWPTRWLTAWWWSTWASRRRGWCGSRRCSRDRCEARGRLLYRPAAHGVAAPALA
jgi:hypothetical protein